jgi:hypothetical protein
MPYYTSLWQKSAPINHYAPRLRILLPCRQFIFAVADGGPPLPYHPSYPAPQHRSPHRRRRLLPELLLLSWESCYSCLDDLCVFYTEKTEAKRYKSPPSRLSGSPLQRPSKSSVLLTSESSTWVCGRQQCHSSYWQLGRHRFVTHQWEDYVVWLK